MNTERTVVLENVAKQPVGLKDTQGRTYRLGVDGKIRISEVSLQDILDYPASKIIFNEGMVKVSNISVNTLYKMGLTEKEIKLYAKDLIEETPEEPAYEEVVEETAEEVKEEIKEEIKEELKEEVKEEIIKVVKEEKKTTTAPKKKSTAKKSTKKSSTKKSK
jgi:hypothetical protein